MGRIRSRASTAQLADLSTSSPTKQLPHKRRKKNGSYKVILESVTQKRKKLRLSATFDPHPPPGYTFVEFGNAKLSAQCKEFCRKRGEPAYAVSAPPKNNATADPEKISFHVNRIGFHFPNKIVDLAAEWLGIQIGGPRPKSKNGFGFTQGLSRRLRAHVDLSEEDRVRAAMRDLFPKMPEDSLEAIVEHAFAEGAKRVGNATNLSLERRVQMAVLAHVRHKHTDYDKLLKEVGYIQARKTVENPCIEKILAWRGENTDEDDEVVEMEDDFREVIVLDDSDDNGSDDDDECDSESSVEHAPNPHAPAGHQSRAHHHIPNTHAPSVARPKSFVEPISTQGVVHGTPHNRHASHRTLHIPEAARPRAAPRGYIPVPSAEMDHRPRVRTGATRDAPPLAFPHEIGGRYRPEQYHSRRVADQDPYGDVQRVQVARSDHDKRLRVEPRPEDVVMPSIERDEPSSAHPTSSNDQARYLSHQERSLMQRPIVHEHEGVQAHRRMEGIGDHGRRAPQADAIDLTDSPTRAPRDIRLGNRQLVTVQAHDARRMQPRNPSTDERYYDRRAGERAGDPGTNMVGDKDPSLSFLHKASEQPERRHLFDRVERSGPTGSRSNPLQLMGGAGDNRSDAHPFTNQNLPSPRLASHSYVANLQSHERPSSLKRRSGDWMVESEAQDDRSAYSVRRRVEGPFGPGRVLGTVDTPGPSHRPRAPMVAERLVGEPQRGHHSVMMSSPTRMRLSHAYDDLAASDDPVRQSIGGDVGYRPAPSAHLYDYRPATGVLCSCNAITSLSKRHMSSRRARRREARMRYESQHYPSRQFAPSAFLINSVYHHNTSCPMNLHKARRIRMMGIINSVENIERILSQGGSKDKTIVLAWLKEAFIPLVGPTRRPSVPLSSSYRYRGE